MALPLTPATSATLVVRLDALTALRRDARLDTNAALAAAIGVDQSTVGRVLAGRTEPSTRFVAGLTRLAEKHGRGFGDLFETQ